MDVAAATADAGRLASLVPHYFRTHMATMPPLNDHARRVLSVARDCVQLSQQQILGMLKNDPALATELLHVANCPLYRPPSAARTVPEAIARLGSREVYGLLVTLATHSLYEPSMRSVYAVLPQQWQRLHDHAAVCAFGAAWLANHLGVATYETAFVAGMFYDVGKLGALYAICGLILDEQVNFHVSEHAAAKVIEDLHVPLGRKMLGSWGLAPAVVELCCRHHRALKPENRGYGLSHVLRVVSNLDSLRDTTVMPPRLEAELCESLQIMQLEGEPVNKISRKLSHISKQVKGLLAMPHEVDLH